MATAKNSKARLKKTYLSLYLEESQAKALKTLSERTRIAQQVYLREGVDMLLAHYKKELRV